jgi:hypothetical protein
MTIRRQYSLPNCTLILEGLSDSPTDSSSTTGMMSTLVNAECHFLGSNKILSGGRVFFESLVKSVSAYAQEFLSGIHHPQPSLGGSHLVRIQKIDDRNLHRLTLEPESSSDNHSSDTSHEPTQVDLTTVQLFDLMETIDRFFTDNRTLPDLALELRPLSRRYRQAEEPFVQRATPAALGIAGLAACAFAFSLIPPPTIRKPEPKPQASPSQTLPNSTPSSTTNNNNSSNPNLDRTTPAQTPSSNNNSNSNSPASKTSPTSLPSSANKTNPNPNPDNVPPPINIPSTPSNQTSP